MQSAPNAPEAPKWEHRLRAQLLRAPFAPQCSQVQRRTELLLSLASSGAPKTPAARTTPGAPKPLPRFSGQRPLFSWPGEGVQVGLSLARGARQPPRPSAPARNRVLGPAAPTQGPGPVPCEAGLEPQAWSTPSGRDPHDPLSRAGRCRADPDIDLPVFALVFLLLPHRVTAALAAPSPLCALSQTHCPPADFGLRSAPSAPRCRLSHPAPHGPAHWDRAHMVRARSAQAHLPAASACGRRAWLNESCPSGRASPLHPPARPERSAPFPQASAAHRRPRDFQVLEPKG